MNILNLISIVLYIFFIKQVDCYAIVVYKISKTKSCVLMDTDRTDSGMK